ncbi:hypothetical protein D3C76_1575870 [compost metagenome]
MQQHALDVGRSNHRRPALQGRVAGVQGRVHQRSLAGVEILVQRRQQPGPGDEVVVDDGLGHPRLIRQPSQCQGVAALLPHQSPGDIQQLSLPVMPG